jgi:hypothetical protein
MVARKKQIPSGNDRKKGNGKLQQQILVWRWAGAVELRSIPAHDDKAVMNGAPGGRKDEWGQWKKQIPRGNDRKKGNGKYSSRSSAYGEG